MVNAPAVVNRLIASKLNHMFDIKNNLLANGNFYKAFFNKKVLVFPSLFFSFILLSIF
jgi:hypothetical protein